MLPLLIAAVSTSESATAVDIHRWDGQSITSAQKAAFEQSGFLVLAGLLPDLMVHDVAHAVHDSPAALHGGNHSLLQRLEFAGHQVRTQDATLHPLSEPLSGEELVTIQEAQAFPGLSEPLRRITEDKALHKAVEQLLNAGSAQLLAEKVVLKAPRRGPGFAVHQDHIYLFHLFAKRSISAFVALDEHDIGNGCVQVAAGLHLQGAMLGPYGYESPMNSSRLSGAEFQCVKLARGEVLLFDGFTPHRSDPNFSSRRRNAYIASYIPGQLRISSGSSSTGARNAHAEHGQLWAQWHALGLPAGFSRGIPRRYQ